MHRLDKQEARRHWDSVAASYTGHKEANHDYFDALKALFSAALPDASRLRILEVGCGNGDVLRSLKPSHGLGLDVSEAMIAVAKKRHVDCPAVEFRVGDAENLSEEHLYDAVILPDLLEHVPDWRLALSEAASRVKPGGRLAVSTPNPLWAPALYVLEKLRLKTPEGPHRFVGLNAITRHLQELRLVVVNAGNHLLIPKHFGRLTTWLNRRLRGVRGMARLGLIQFAVAERPLLCGETKADE
jgi:2-polyprenyl-3-methyl-5-hydroxy-6-metoxy-1,4-benzoquinol methylase